MLRKPGRRTLLSTEGALDEAPLEPSMPDASHHHPPSCRTPGACETPVVRVVLEIDDWGDRFGGRLRHDGCTVEFAGWLPLISAIDDLRRPAVPARSPPG